MPKILKPQPRHRRDWTTQPLTPAVVRRLARESQIECKIPRLLRPGAALGIIVGMKKKYSHVRELTVLCRTGRCVIWALRFARSGDCSISAKTSRQPKSARSLK